MARALIGKGAMTSTGGRVLEGNTGIIIDGAVNPASVGHSASCKICDKGEGPIVAVGHRTICLSAGPVALAGDYVACGCLPLVNILVAEQSSVVGDDEIAGMEHGSGRGQNFAHTLGWSSGANDWVSQNGQIMKTVSHCLQHLAWHPMSLAVNEADLQRRMVGIVPDSKQFAGTVYFGGAGLNGTYIDDMVLALIEYGVDAKAVDRGRLSGGPEIDAVLGTLFLREQMDAENFPSELDLPTDKNGQFNLVGYSFGSLLAAQFAAKYADQGMVIDHLVLVGSPIAKAFLNTLKEHPNISNIMVKNLTSYGDPIYAGMSLSDAIGSILALMGQDAQRDGSGHFYYRCSDCGEIGRQRRRALAQALYDGGLR